MASNKRDAIQESRVMVMRSPMLAAIGVATLSGLMFNFFEASITAIITIPATKICSSHDSHFIRNQAIPNTKLAREAVTRLLAHNSSPWSISNLPSGIQPIIMAAIDAKNPTTIAWHYVKINYLSRVVQKKIEFFRTCMRDKLPTMRLHCCFGVSM
jgi:hypothetical protein